MNAANAAEIVKSWLATFDKVIDALALDPTIVKGDSFLRRCFELAFPPQGLPAKLTFKQEGGVSSLRAVEEAHRPYYTAKATVREVSKNGDVKVTSQLDLRLKDASGIVLVLSQNDLIRDEVEMVQRALSKAKSRRRPSEHRKIANLLKVRHRQKEELAQLESLLSEAREQDDKRMVDQYEERYRGLLQSILNDQQIVDKL